MKYPFIARHRAVWSVSVLCRVLGVSRSGYYEWLGRGPSAREQANIRLAGRIRQSFEASDRTYGSPRVWRDLRAWVGCGAVPLAPFCTLCTGEPSPPVRPASEAR